MNRLWLFLFLGLALALVAGTAQAADLGNLSGQSCGDGCGTFHFVNNQTGGASTGTIDASFSGSADCISGPSKVNNSNIQFVCGGCGTLTGASTDLPGKLVLSDFSCGKKGCDPKTDPKCTQ